MVTKLKRAYHVVHWRDAFAKQEQTYLRAKADFLLQSFPDDER